LSFGDLIDLSCGMRSKAGRLNPSQIEGSRRSGPPATIKPSLATLVDKAPIGDDWLHEVKFDGYRILAHVEGGCVRLISRNAHDWTRRFKAIAGELARLKVKDAVPTARWWRSTRRA